MKIYVNIAMNVNTNVTATTQSSSKMQTSMNNSQKFGTVFGQILSNSQLQPIAAPQATSEGNVLQDLLAILNTTSLEELESLVESVELTVNPKELKVLLEKLLGTESDKTLVITDPKEELIESNVWDLLAGINQQATKIIDAIISSLNGQGPSNPADAKQAVELLKTVQLIGNKSDLAIKEESTLFDIKQLLENVKETVGKLPTNETPSSQQVLKQPINQTQVIVKQLANSIQPEVVTETKEITTSVQGSTNTVVQTKVETVSMTLPTEKATQSEEFIKELQKVMNRVQFGQAGGANRLVLKLFPEHLGTIRIELIQKDGMLTAKILASTALGKEMLDSNSSQLRQGFAGQNIQLEKLEITQALQESARQDKNQTFQQSFKQQQQEEQEQQENGNDQLEEQFSFQDYLHEMEV